MIRPTSSPSVDRPADIKVMTADRLVVLMVDPATAEQIAGSWTLSGHLAAAGVNTRPNWEREAAQIAAAAEVARHTDGLARLGDELAALGAVDNLIQLRPVQAESGRTE